MTFSYQELMLSLALTVYLTVCSMVGVVRAGHKCAAYTSHVDYYFPAWRTLVFCSLSNLSLLPVIFLPSDPDALLQLRMMLLLASPFFCSVLIFSYFGRILKASWWKKPTYAMSFSYLLMEMIALVITLMPGTQMQGMFSSIYFIVAGLLAAGYLIALVSAVLMVVQQLGHFSEESFSNPDDFPEQYAKSLIYIPALHLVLSWSVTFNGRYPALCIGLLLLSVLSAVILLGSLSPHRALEVDRLKTELDASQTEAVTEADLSQERKEEILASIRKQVEDEHAYLDNHLTLSKLSQACGFNRTYVSAVLNERLGGFFSYVNNCRLAHAETFKATHPQADVDEVALISGFNSRQSYYNARKRTTVITPAE